MVGTTWNRLWQQDPTTIFVIGSRMLNPKFPPYPSALGPIWSLGFGLCLGFGGWELVFLWILELRAWIFWLVLALLATFTADAVHKVNEREEHGDDDATDHDGEEDNHDRFEQ